MNKKEELFGHIERITFQNGENGYTVAQLQEPKNPNLICIVGIMPALQPGETVRCFGFWKQHLVHGRQFEVAEFRTETPADIIGIKKYLGSGLVRGIGATYAGKIVDAFGTETLEIIDKNPERLLEVPRLGPKRVEKIKACWEEQKTIRDVMIFLQSHGVTPAYAQKIFKAYGDQSVKKVSENPYQLARDIFGIGFKTADTIAEKMGISKDSSQRIDAGIEYVLLQLSNEGHVCYPVKEFLVEAQGRLEIDPFLIRGRLEVLKQEDRIELFELLFEHEKQSFIWAKFLFMAEVGIAKELKRLKFAESCLRKVDQAKALAWVQKQLKIDLAPNQQIAVAQSLVEKIQIITGGPGTGKSTITNAILKISEQLTSKILLAAPTGRAAKRMTEITGKKASTIHSLLEFDFKARGFKRNRDSPLDCDLIIIDESSMIDTQLMYHLLKAIPNHARVVFVGDVNQLPSVGPGNVLQDMISSNSLPVTQLNEIFRQAAGSRIITNAHRINKGTFPEIAPQSNSDFFFIEALENEQVLKEIISLVTVRIPQKYGFHALNEIQVLAPMKKGIIGTENLNAILQESLNGKGVSIQRGGQLFRVGDKVMQIRNNYQREVFNGDIGRIQEIDLTDQEMIVLIDEREVAYDFSDLDELVLAYAVSVHKYQGSECPCIVMPVHTSHFKLLHRNLLYTGVTRGKKLVVLVGTKRALAIAVGNDEVKRRFTGLKQALSITFSPII